MSARTQKLTSPLGLLALGVVVLAVSVDKRQERIKRFGKRITLPKRVLLDPEGGIAARYEVGGMPWTVLIDPDGNVVWARTGLDEDDHAALATEARRLLETSRQ